MRGLGAEVDGLGGGFEGRDDSGREGGGQVKRDQGRVGEGRVEGEGLGEPEGEVDAGAGFEYGRGVVVEEAEAGDVELEGAGDFLGGVRGGGDGGEGGAYLSVREDLVDVIVRHFQDWADGLMRL